MISVMLRHQFLYANMHHSRVCFKTRGKNIDDYSFLAYRPRGFLASRDSRQKGLGKMASATETAQANNATVNAQQPKLVRGLSLLDATMIVIGSMIGSGIFLVSAESSKLVGAPGWLLVAWALAAVLTITGALSCAELAAMMPRAGGQYVFLREAYGSSIGFLFGWALFLVVQTGTIAAVAVAFANFTGVLLPSISSANYLIAPRVLGRG